jgi:hypothetical protein
VAVVMLFTSQSLFAEKLPLEDFIKLPQFAGLFLRAGPGKVIRK